MDDKKMRKRLGADSRGHTNLLRTGVILLAVVSFFTTANGMRKYIFTNEENGLVAYAASAAIQSILLALSMNFLDYLRSIWANAVQEEKGKFHWLKEPVRFLGKVILSLIVFLLTGVVIFCSSWFSYVYIAETIHQTSWEADSELLVQQTYRSELYDAQDYAHIYRTYLEGNIGERLLLLEAQAMNLSDPVETDMDWDAERADYAPDDGSTAASYMATVIDAMEKAVDSNSSQEARDLAVMAISDAKENIESRMADIQQNMDMLTGNINNYNSQIASLRNTIARSPAGVDTTPYLNSINTYTQQIDRAVQRQGVLQSEYMDLERAQGRLPLYESRLGLSNSTSAISIRSDLMRLQAEFFRQKPNEEQMLELAANIFENMLNASRAAARGDAAEGAGSGTEALPYMELLTQMNGLIRGLTDYNDLADIESNLNNLVEELRTLTLTADPEVENADGNAAAPDMENADGDAADPEAENADGDAAAPDVENADGDAAPSDMENADGNAVAQDTENADGNAAAPDVENADGDAAPSDMENADGDAAEPDTENVDGNVPSPSPQETEEEQEQDNEPSKEQESRWKEAWGVRLEALKAQISALPVFADNLDTGEATGDSLSESQKVVLRSYDRDRSSRELDDMIRRYISDHNAIYQGIIYLQSPYRSLAGFAALLALSFDVSGFIFGFAIQGKERNGGNGEAEGENTKKEDKNNSTKKPDKKDDQRKLRVPNGDSEVGWSILETLTPYLVLTGDYEKRDGIFYYTAFKDGVLYRWPVKDIEPYLEGIYIQKEEKDQAAKGERISADRQDLLFASQNSGPKDGVYTDCQLVFDEGSLLMIRDGKKVFLAAVDEYVPVHIYSPNKGENRTDPVNQLVQKGINVTETVVALNVKGTRVAAVYAIEKA